MKPTETPMEELVSNHHKQLRERVKGQLKKLIKEILKEDTDERLRV